MASYQDYLTEIETATPRMSDPTNDEDTDSNSGGSLRDSYQ